MKIDRWDKIQELFYAALACGSVERRRYLEKACGGDLSLRREVESLVASFEKAEADNFLRSIGCEKSDGDTI